MVSKIINCPLDHERVHECKGVYVCMCVYGVCLSMYLHTKKLAVIEKKYMLRNSLFSILSA